MTAVIRANSQNGCDNCVYGDPLPQALRDAGMAPAQWASLLAEANVAVKYNWVKVCCAYGLLGVCGTCSFLCNCHNKTVQGPMQAFCRQVNSDGVLPAGFSVSYGLKTEKMMVQGHEGKGATLESWHVLTFKSAGGPGSTSMH